MIQITCFPVSNGLGKNTSILKITLYIIQTHNQKFVGKHNQLP